MLGHMVETALPADPVAALAVAVDGLLTLEPAGDLACGQLLVAVLAQRNRLDAAVHRLVRLAAAAGTASADGAASMAAWLRWRARLAPGEAAGLVRTAARLSELTDTAKAFTEGEISARHASAVTDLLADVPVEAVRLAEPALLDLAREADPRLVTHAAGRVREAAFPDGTAEARRRLYDGRFVTLTEGFAGGFDLVGRLTAEAAATLHAALAPLLVPTGPEDGRTARQRRHDGLAELARLAMAGGELPTTGGERTRVTVLVDWSSVTATSDRGSDGGDGPDGPVPVAELAWGGEVGPAVLRRLACDAEIARVVLGPAGEVLDLGRTSRLPSPAQRRALAVRDGGCVFPGCDRPPGWCQAHHRRHWVDGGRTDLGNLLLLCAFHHRLIHEGQWRLDPDGAGGWTATAPDGRRLHRPARRPGRRRRTRA